MEPADITPRFNNGLNFAKSMRRNKHRNPNLYYRGTEFAHVRSRNAQVVKLVIFGSGMVGSSLIRRLIAERPTISQLHNVDYRISCVLDSTGFLYSGNNFGIASHIGDGVLLNALSLKEVNKSPLRVYPDCGYYYSDFERIRHTLMDCATIAVDCTNPGINTRNRDWAITSVLTDHVTKGGATITANKQNAVRCMDDCMSTVPQSRRFSLNPALCAGGSISSAMSQLLRNEMNCCGGYSGVSGVRGLFSPFWNEILTQISDHLAITDSNHISIRFSDLVLHCMKQRLTSSRDPRNDLFGLDLCDTARIFSNILCFAPVHFDLDSRTQTNSHSTKNGPIDHDDLDMDLIDLESNLDIDRLMNDFVGNNELDLPSSFQTYDSILSIFPDSVLDLRENGSLQDLMKELRQCDETIMQNILNLMKEEREKTGNESVSWKTHCIRCLSSFDCESETVIPGQLVIVNRMVCDGDSSGMLGRCRGNQVCMEIISDTHDDCDQPLYIQGKAGGVDSVVSSIISELSSLSAMLING